MKKKCCRRKKYIQKLNKVIISFVLVFSILLCSVQPVKADFIDEAVSEEEVIKITYYDENHNIVGEPDVSHTIDGSAGTPYIASVTIYTMTKDENAEKIVEAEWEIGDSTYLFSENSRFKNISKKDNVIYVDPSGYAGKNAGDMESAMKTALRDEPDYRALPTIKGLKFASLIRVMIRGVMNGIANWIADTLGVTFDDMVVEFSQFGPDITYIKEVFTVNTEDGTHNYFSDFLLVFSGMGVFLSFFIFIIILFLSFGASMTGLEEHPLELILRWVVAIFLIFRGREVLDYIFKITQSFISSFGTFITGADTQVDIVSNLFQYSDIPIILNIVLVVLIIFEYLRLMLEIIERYIVTMVMYIVSPLAFASFTSKSSSKITVQFIKMFISQMIVYVLTLWMANVVCMVIANVPYAMELKSPFNQMIHYFFILGLIKCAYKFDEYMKDMGMTVARSAANLGGAIMATAGMTYGAMRAIGSAGRVAGRAYDRYKGPGGNNTPPTGGTGSKVVTDPNSKAASKPDAKLAKDAAEAKITKDPNLMRGLGITQEDIKNKKVGNFTYDKGTGTGTFDKIDKDGKVSSVKFSTHQKEGYDVEGVNGVFFSNDSVKSDTPTYSFQGREGIIKEGNFSYANTIDALNEDTVNSVFAGMGSKEITADDMANIKVYENSAGTGGRMEWNDGNKTHCVTYDYGHKEYGQYHTSLVGGGEITTYRNISSEDIARSMETNGRQSVFESKVIYDAAKSCSANVLPDAKPDLSMWDASGYSKLATNNPDLPVYISDPSRCTVSSGIATNLNGQVVMVSSEKPKARKI